MPTPSGGYFRNNKRVPSVTTIIGRFKNTDALMSWAHRMGKEGRDYKAEGRRAAKAGTACHDMIEQFLASSPITFESAAKSHKLDEEQLGWLKKAYNCFLEWHTNYNPRIDEMELAFISDKYLYGGTPDAVGIQDDGRRILFDWKTSGRIYSDYYIQAAAYSALYEECTGHRISSALIVRFDKSGKTAEEVTIERAKLLDYFKIFKQMRQLYGSLDAEKML